LPHTRGKRPPFVKILKSIFLRYLVLDKVSTAVVLCAITHMNYMQTKLLQFESYLGPEIKLKFNIEVL